MVTLWLWRLRTLRRRLWLGYSRGDLVLDVGSGHRPHPRADLLCDRHLALDSERGGPLVADRPLVGGDLTALPFRDKSVDFVICQHVLEHVDDPAAALEELMRVGRAGYIETPTPLWEKLVGPTYHRWMVERQGRKLVCTAKPACVPYRDLLPRFEAFARGGRAWHLLTLEQFDAFHTTMVWRDRIEYEVRLAPPGSGEDHGSEPLAPSSADPGRRERWLRALKPAVLGSLGRLVGRGPRPNLEALIACPFCHGLLAPGRTWLSCAACRVRYPVRGGVPVLLRSAAEPIGTRGPARAAPEPVAAARG